MRNQSRYCYRQYSDDAGQSVFHAFSLDSYASMGSYFSTRLLSSVFRGFEPPFCSISHIFLGPLPVGRSFRNQQGSDLTGILGIRCFPLHVDA